MTDGPISWQKTENWHILQLSSPPHEPDLVVTFLLLLPVADEVARSVNSPDLLLLGVERLFPV